MKLFLSSVGRSMHQSRIPRRSYRSGAGRPPSNGAPYKGARRSGSKINFDRTPPQSPYADSDSDSLLSWRVLPALPARAAQGRTYPCGARLGCSPPSQLQRRPTINATRPSPSLAVHEIPCSNFRNSCSGTYMLFCYYLVLSEVTRNSARWKSEKKQSPHAKHSVFVKKERSG